MLIELTKLGLTSEEAKVYIACLEIDGGPVSVIAKKAGVGRVACYHTLDKLVQKRLLTVHSKKGVKRYSPEPPEKIEQIAKEQVNIAHALVPELKSITASIGFKPKIQFYEGMEGIERVFTESLSAQGEILGYTNLEHIITYIPDFFRDYTKKRLSNSIKTRYLSPNTVPTVEVVKDYLPENYNPNLVEILLINKDQFPFENEVLIFENKVGIISLNPEEQLGLIVESATFSKTMKAVFDLAWLGATAFVAR